MGAEVMVTWDTWEELLLGGAVLRHGTRDWTVVAAELRTRTRTVSACTFTPEACKTKYEDLQQRYSGSMAWFEELKKKRVAELKRALELSEDSIGSLESKLETLKAGKNDKKNDCHVGNGSAGPELHVPSQKLERVESSTKETSKEGLSAGSFTHETRTNWSPECQVLIVSSEDMEIKPEGSGSAEQEKVLNVDKLEHTIYEGQTGSLKKRRGKRKRKDCGRNINETSVRESDVLDSVDVSRCKESSTSNCNDVAKSSGIDEENKKLKKDEIKDMMEILDSILEVKGASAFRRRLDSQKRGRYKKMIRQHMDFDTIRSRISSQTIKSAMELFRDLLLLPNNALAFYSKSTREYKSAQLLRDIVIKKLRENIRGFSSSVTNASVSITLPVSDPPVKLTSVRPGNHKIVAKPAGGSNSASEVSHGGAKKPSIVDSPLSVESLPIKKYSGRPKKVGRGTTGGGQSPATPMKGKKRVRKKDFRRMNLHALRRN